MLYGMLLYLVTRFELGLTIYASIVWTILVLAGIVSQLKDSHFCKDELRLNSVLRRCVRITLGVEGLMAAISRIGSFKENVYNNEKTKFESKDAARHFPDKVIKVPIGNIEHTIRLSSNGRLGNFLTLLDMKKDPKVLNIIFSRKSNPHVIIFGESGSGKTTLAMSIACRLPSNIRAVIIDFHGEYSDVLSRCGFCRIDTSKATPDPLKLYGQPPMVRALQLSFLFAHVFGFGRLQRSLINELLLDYYKALPKDNNIKAEPSLRQFILFIEKRLQDSDNSDQKKRLEIILSTLKTMAELVGRSEDSLNNKNRTACRRKIFDLSTLALEPLQEFVADIILRDAYFEAKSSGENTLIIIDEAHRLLYVEKSETVVRQIVQEGRKYGVFMLLITQNPLDIDPRVLNNIASRIVFRMTEKKNLDYVTKLLLGDYLSKRDYAKLYEIVKGLPTGTGIAELPYTNNLIVFRTYQLHSMV